MKHQEARIKIKMKDRLAEFRGVSIVFILCIEIIIIFHHASMNFCAVFICSYIVDDASYLIGNKDNIL